MLSAPLCKISLYLPLRGELWFQRILVVAGGRQKLLPHIIGFAAENVPQHAVGDEWLGQTRSIKVNSARGKFLFLDRNRRDEVAKDALDRVRRATPDAEET